MTSALQKVCDMAMALGRSQVGILPSLLGRAISRVWENAEREHPGCFIVTRMVS